MNDVILHAFDWYYSDIANNAEKIAELGYGAVLIPPPLYSRDDELGKEWWNRYQPKDYRILCSFLGNKVSLERAITALHDNGVRVYADIVFNHMANENRPDRGNFPGDAELQRYKLERGEFEKDRLYGNLDEGLFSPRDFAFPLKEPISRDQTSPLFEGRSKGWFFHNSFSPGIDHLCAHFDVLGPGWNQAPP